MPSCPHLRKHGECACPANLVTHKDALESKGETPPVQVKPNMPKWQETAGEVARLEKALKGADTAKAMELAPQLIKARATEKEWRGRKDVTWVKVDDGRSRMTTRPNPLSPSQPPLKEELHEPPRWVCTTCGAATRTTLPGSHLCDVALLQWRDKKQPLHLSVDPAVRYGGGFQLAISKAPDGTYRLTQQVIRDGRVQTEALVYADGDWPAMEGALLDAVVEAFTP